MQQACKLIAMMLLLTLVIGLCTLEVGAEVMEQAQGEVLYVKDFGAIPDDGKDDAMAIRRAIAAAKKRNVKTLVFEAGVYTLKYPSTGNVMIELIGIHGLTLLGAKSEDGSPNTVFEIIAKLKNDVSGAEGPGHIYIKSSQDIRIENVILDYNPRFGTAGTIVEVDPIDDVVIVDIFPGMSHFPGMKCYSANSWDLDTRQLRPVDALSIGVSGEKFNNTWQPVPGDHEYRYRIQGMGFSDRVEVGQGISWHFNVNSGGNNVRIMDSEDITLRNVHIYNTILMSVIAGFNKNLTFEYVHIKPEGNSLAVGPRDAFHLSNNTGRLLMDHVFIKGVRWDPINMKSCFGEVRAILADDTIRYSLKRNDIRPVEAGSKVVFWVGDEPVERRIVESTPVGNSSGSPLYTLTFTESLPALVEVGSLFTPLGWVFEEGIIRNSVFESNFGTGIVLQNENLLVENNIFRYNAYDNIGLGPTGAEEGGYARNIIIRNNVFEHSTWLNKHNVHEGAISAYYSYHSSLSGIHSRRAYNMGIVIEDNLFQDLVIGEAITGISLRNAQDVSIRNNEFVNVKREFRIDANTTRDIAIDSLNPQ